MLALAFLILLGMRLFSGSNIFGVGGGRP
jgi:hypothetical protein